MTSKLELLRNALLVTLVLLLVYVLYKRLLSVVRKNEIYAKHPPMETSLSIEGNEAKIQLEIKAPAYVIIEVFDAQNKGMFIVTEGDLAAGNHEFSFSTQTLPEGRYYYKVTSPNEEASQYFSK